MKRAILGGLSILFLAAAAAPAVQAETVPTAVSAQSSTPLANGQFVKPFHLVALAYQGFFSEAGIPKYSRLVDAYSRGQVSAEDLIEVAIAENRVPASALSDTSYVNAVDNQLRRIVRDTQND
ncbi:MAG: hypothetical protein HY785_09450 [Oscillatoriophycideae cyanobacterium NC_groundwater_1537_Pr4_S-0.65um_50_18]|nr:hypothetical protein [Oscillatoriophycideae cyanobacterium NC_groundwater_1537_Pr4_S-0.65um_50_18]